jgi:hypothetical protein
LTPSSPWTAQPGDGTKYNLSTGKVVLLMGGMTIVMHEVKT